MMETLLAEYDTHAIVLNLFYWVIAVVGGFAIFRLTFWYMNKSIGVVFKSDDPNADSWFDLLRSGNMAVSLYLSARLILVGMLVSAFVNVVGK